jgi:hypothetical protein
MILNWLCKDRITKIVRLKKISKIELFSVMPIFKKTSKFLNTDSQTCMV